MEFHPIANIFPMMDEQIFSQFQTDIKENTLQDRVIWLYEGKILDGRNRYRACETLKIAYETQTYTGADPVAFVVSRNLHRRHLKENQRAMVVARIADLQPGGQVGNTNQTAQAVNIQKDKVHEEVNLPLRNEAHEQRPTSSPNSLKPQACVGGCDLSLKFARKSLYRVSLAAVRCRGGLSPPPTALVRQDVGGVCARTSVADLSHTHHRGLPSGLNPRPA